MNDKDIKKALVCCLAPKHDCSYCLLEKEVHCTSLLHKNILALIDRQQAEIEKFKNAIKKADQLFSEGFLYDGLAIVARLAIEIERGEQDV